MNIIKTTLTNMKLAFEKSLFIKFATIITAFTIFTCVFLLVFPHISHHFVFTGFRFPLISKLILQNKIKVVTFFFVFLSVLCPLVVMIFVNNKLK